jgi:hypothetical protein
VWEGVTNRTALPKNLLDENLFAKSPLAEKTLTTGSS